MKNIGICINSLDMGGAERLLVDIIKLLLKTKKYRIRLLTTVESESPLLKELDEEVEYTFLLFKNENKKRFFSKLRNSLLKRKRFKKFTRDLDIVIDFLDSDFYKYIKKSRVNKKVTWLHSNYKSLITRKKIDKKINVYDQVIVITRGMYNELKGEKNIKKLSQIYNIIDFDRIDYKLKEDLNKQEKELINKKYFLTVCRLNENEKDVTTLIKAYKKYRGEEKLYIIGDGESRKELENLVTREKLEDKIFFLGTKLNPYIYMKNAKAFILSSKLEGFGLVLVEALYCGTKVISSNCEYGPEEILLDGKIGEMFEVGDIDALLNRLNLINKKFYDERLIKKSLESYEKNIILKKIQDEILD